MIVDEIPNTPPKFSGTVGPVFKVELIKGVDGEIEGDPDVTYTSPKAVDPQKDKILMDFVGGKTFMRIKKADDDTFYIKVNKGLTPKKSATYPISIGLEDARGAKQLVKSKMAVEITFTGE